MSRRWPPRLALTVRTRLALLYGTLFLLGGAALLGVTLPLVDQALRHQPVDRAAVAAHRAQGRAADQPNPNDSPAPGATPDPAGAASPGTAEDDYRLAESLRRDFRAETISTLLTWGGAALAGLALVGAWLGWLVAGRTLLPLRQITATARQIADDNLHRRIGLAGPRDELRELADTVDAMLGRLDAAFDSQRLFVANASHELKTPLAISRTLLEVALDDPQVPAQWRRLGTDLLVVNARQERLLGALLALARVDHTTVTPVPVDLGAVAAAVAAAAQPPDGVRLALTTAAVTVPGDPAMLERLVENLLENALRYNQPAGWVRVVVEPAADGVLLRVTNSGPVIAAAEVAGLFEPFRRHDARVGSATGSGLGLSIVRSVVRAHHGEVHATPGPEGGLAVEVHLPAAWDH